MAKQFNPMVYCDWFELFETMTPEERSEVLLAIAGFPNYQPQGVNCWRFFQKQLQKQYDNLTALCEKRQQIAIAREEKKKATNSTSVHKSEQVCTSHTDVHLIESESKSISESKDIYTTNSESVSAPSSALEEPRRADNKKASAIQKPEDVVQEDWTAFLKLRKDKKMPLTQRALELMRAEGKKANLSMQQVIVKCLEESWAGFKAAWLENKPMEKHEEPSIHKVKNPGPPPSKDDDGWKAQEAYFRRIGMFKGLAS